MEAHDDDDVIAGYEFGQFGTGKSLLQMRRGLSQWFDESFCVCVGCHRDQPPVYVNDETCVYCGKLCDGQTRREMLEVIAEIIGPEPPCDAGCHPFNWLACTHQGEIDD